MKRIIKEGLFKDKIIYTINLCNGELANRKNGLAGESTVEQLEDVILPELKELLEKVNNNQYPHRKYRYLVRMRLRYGAGE